MLEMLMSPEIWASFLTLCVLEIVLGIDNIIFLSIITGKLPKEKQATARMIGLSLALGMRIALLFCIAWMVKMQSDLFTVFGHGVPDVKRHRDLLDRLLGQHLMQIPQRRAEIGRSGVVLIQRANA